jgi:hypothetical protein
MVGLLVNDNLEYIWREVVVAQLLYCPDICLYSVGNERVVCPGKCSNQALSNTKLGYVPMKTINTAN